MAQRFWNGPVAHALLPRRQHDLARIKNFDCRRRSRTVAASNPPDAGAISTNSQPLRTVTPTTRLNQSRYSAQSSRGIRSRLLPILLPEPCLVPGLVGEARDIEIRAGVILRAAQRMHAGIGEPWPFPPLLGFVQDQDVGDLRAHQPEGRGDAGLAGAHDEHVQRRLAVRPRLGRKPRGMRMRVLARSSRTWASRAIRALLMPQANRHPPPSRCRS